MSYRIPIAVVAAGVLMAASAQASDTRSLFFEVEGMRQCLSQTDFCDRVRAETATSASTTPGGSAAATAVTQAACDAGADAAARVQAVVMGAAEFYAPKYKATSEISVKAELVAASMMIVETEPEGVALSQASAQALAEAQATGGDPCATFDSELCLVAPALATASAEATGDATAMAVAEAFSSVRSSSQAALRSSVYAKARDILEFRASLALAAENFAVSQSAAATAALSNAFARALARVCVSGPVAPEPASLLEEYCDGSSATAEALATAHARAFGVAFAEALAGARIKAQVTAKYKRKYTSWASASLTGGAYADLACRANTSVGPR